MQDLWNSFLCIAVKAMNDTMDENSRAHFRLVFGIASTFPIINGALPRIKHLIETLKTIEAVICATVAERRIQTAITPDIRSPSVIHSKGRMVAVPPPDGLRQQIFNAFRV